MKTLLVILLFVVYFAECRKAILPIDKNANIAFINMEGGGGIRPAPGPKINPKVPNQALPPKPVPATPTQNAAPAITPAPAKPAVQTPTKPVVQTPAHTPSKPAQQPPQLAPKPVNPSPIANPISTPGPGTVKQLVNFYDSQGKASPIRPYSYSQAVKQGK